MKKRYRVVNFNIIQRKVPISTFLLLDEDSTGFLKTQRSMN